MAGVRSAVRRLYLSVYNWVVFFGWAQVLYYAALALLESGHETVYAAVERPLQFAQTAAIMEGKFMIENVGYNQTLPDDQTHHKEKVSLKFARTPEPARRLILQI